MKLIPILPIAASLLSACIMEKPEPVYETSRVLDYPSGSTICYAGDRFYVMGDDAAEILVLNDTMGEVERIGIFAKRESARLEKKLKADVESSALINYKGQPAVLFLGSGSFSPHRDSAFIFNPQSKKTIRLDTKAFYDELRLGVKDVNIEAAATVGKELILGLRGNTSHPHNYIARSEFDGMKFQFKSKVEIQTPINNTGISGMDYSETDDILFIAFSSEDTSNSYDDGRIGESYLAILGNAKSALEDSEIVIRNLIKLTDLSPEFIDQKIESVSLTNEPHKLMLVADDDRGGTKVFMIRY